MNHSLIAKRRIKISVDYLTLQWADRHRERIWSIISIDISSLIIPHTVICPLPKHYLFSNTLHKYPAGLMQIA